MAAAKKCLELDRAMLERVQASRGGELHPKDPDDYLDPALWDHYVEARRDLVDFTTSNIEVLVKSRSGGPQGSSRPEADSDIEKRLVSSLSEMAMLEEKLAAYLTENLEVLRKAVTDLTRNQTLFTKYAKAGAKPEPERLSSQL
jgi:hypothetical protein